MKIMMSLILTLVCIFCVSEGVTQDDISAKISPEAINARIADIRKGHLIIKTKPGAEVSVKQVRHEFLFGTAITDNLAEKSANAMSENDRKMFLKILEENFNYAVHENALKWYDTEVEYKKVDYYLADRIYELCAERNCDTSDPPGHIYL